MKRHLRVHCALDRAEALRRGYGSTNDVITLSIGVAELTTEQRLKLASRLRPDGYLQSLKGGLLKLSTPTAAAIWEAVENEEAESRQAAERERQAAEDRVARIHNATVAVLDERKTRPMRIYIRQCGEGRPECTTANWEAHWDSGIDYPVPAWPAAASVKVMDSVPARAWLAELEPTRLAAQEKALEAYRVKCVNDELARREAEEKKNQQQKALLAWIEQRGSAHLRALVAHGDTYNWKNLAYSEWLDWAALAPAAALLEEEKYVKPRATPTLYELTTMKWAVAHHERADQPSAEVSLQEVTYCDGESQTEMKFDFVAPDGTKLSRYCIPHDVESALCTLGYNLQYPLV